MATQLFLLDAVADTHLATDNTNMLGTAVGWTSKALGLARGSGVIASDAVATVAGATAGVTITKTQAVEWISPPLAADVTISGTITLNLWASESAAQANVAINARIFVIRANATATRNSNTLVTIATTARTTEVATPTRAANNFTVAPTSTVVNKGDRLRIIVFGDDAGTMGSGRTFNASWNGTSAAADGDSYVTFTETFSFASGTIQAQTVGGANASFGNPPTAAGQHACSFTASTDRLDEVRVWLRKEAAPTDDAVIEVQTDSAGVPSGSVVAAVATVNNASLTTTLTEYTYATSISLTAGQKYWLVFHRSGTLDITNKFYVGVGLSGTAGWSVISSYNGTSWVAGTSYVTVRLAFASTTLYLTDTVSAVATADTDYEARTTRGDAVASVTTSSAAGWTAPIQLGPTSWFTPQLEAFTLTGMAVANLWLRESVATVNGSARFEIARVDADGTNPTVWANWCIAPITTDLGELGTSNAARTVSVSGDDLAISQGQRLRFRCYSDDMSSAAMASGGSVTLRIDGNTAATDGDTYVTLPQTITVYTPTPSVLEQEAYRFRNDNGNETTATWRQTLNTPDTIALDAGFRVRFAIENTGATFAGQYKVQYRRKPSGGAFGSWTDVAGGTPVIYNLSTGYSDLTATTQQISSGTFDSGFMREDTALSGTLNHPGSTWTEVEFTFATLSTFGAALLDEYELRLVQETGSVVFDTYTQTASFTITGAVPAYIPVGFAVGRDY